MTENQGREGWKEKRWKRRDVDGQSVPEGGGALALKVPVVAVLEDLRVSWPGRSGVEEHREDISGPGVALTIGFIRCPLGAPWGMSAFGD